MNGLVKCLKYKDWHSDTLRNRDYDMLQSQRQRIEPEELQTRPRYALVLLGLGSNKLPLGGNYVPVGLEVDAG
jgi:hypothetical protein